MEDRITDVCVSFETLSKSLKTRMQKKKLTVAPPTMEYLSERVLNFKTYIKKKTNTRVNSPNICVQSHITICGKRDYHIRDKK